MKINFHFNRIQNRLIAFLIGILGFSAACDKIINPAPVVEYGAPSAIFIISGTVVNDSSNAVIPGIQVTMADTFGSYADTCLTDINGHFLTECMLFPVSMAFNVQFEDVDGNMNGSFQTKDTLISFNNPKFTNGDGSWDVGSVTDVIHVGLKPKSK